MRQPLAKLLRRLADRIDPPAARTQGEPVTPLEFIPTADLATEVARRSDAAVVFWARHDCRVGGAGRGRLRPGEGGVTWRLMPAQLAPLMNMIVHTISDEMGKRRDAHG